jgi:hypothetical protein
MTTALRLVDLSGPILAGSGRGSLAWPKVQEAASQAPVVYLDFTEVEVVTASYFRTAITPLWAMEDLGVPVLANVAGECQEDIRLALEMRGHAVWQVLFGVDQAVTDPRILGTLDAELLSVLQSLLNRGPITAASIAGQDQTVTRTAWNNRLAGLWRGRLLCRWKRGREHHYGLPWQEGIERG